MRISSFGCFLCCGSRHRSRCATSPRARHSHTERKFHLIGNTEIICIYKYNSALSYDLYEIFNFSTIMLSQSKNCSIFSLFESYMIFFYLWKKTIFTPFIDVGERTHLLYIQVEGIIPVRMF